jgi:hypothetical protein
VDPETARHPADVHGADPAEPSVPRDADPPPRQNVVLNPNCIVLGWNAMFESYCG